MTTHVVILGGGAAGFFSAIVCAESNPRINVTLIEKGLHVLTKVRISGGGRCNVTHACFEPKKLVSHYPRGGQALLGPFHSFQPKDTVAWFEAHGVLLKTEEDGRMFPTTDTSLTIINALKDAAHKAGVKIKTQTSITSVQCQGKDFQLKFDSGETTVCQRLLLATGSSRDGYSIASNLGHQIIPPVPSLFTFSIPDQRLKDLAGISVDQACITLGNSELKQQGPVLITHWGLSGPAILKLSAWGARFLFEKSYQIPLKINWVGIEPLEVLAHLKDIKTSFAKKAVAGYPQWGIPRRLWERLCETSALNPTHRWADMSNPQMMELTQNLTSSEYWLRGKSTFKDEFVTCGGVDLNQVNFKTMESRIQPGLHFAGEILDIDGVTGGFNFQNAWTTGWLAGRAMSQN